MKELSVEQAQAAYKSGELTCRQVVQGFLDRIAALDRDGPKINSILAQSSTALEEADTLDSQLKATGQFVGPLHGIPVVVKDQADTKGITTTYGSVIAKDNVPTEDAAIIKKLKVAGAIILAKTTMPDWATSWHSTSSVSGLTCNPYSLDRDPGGSSSGTGAAIAANLAILGVGEDTGGSIRVPASFCGLVGLRCTPGLISRVGLSPLLVPQDTAGPMTKTVRDAALMLDVLVGFDEGDSYTSTAVLAGPPAGGSYASNLDAKPLSKARIGVLRSLFGPESDPDCKSVNSVINSSLATLEKAGCTLVDVSIPNLEHYLAFTSTYFTCSHAFLDEFFKTRKPHLNTDVSKIYSEKKYHPALDLFEGFATGPVTPEQDPEYLQRVLQREEFRRLVISAFGSHKVDAIAVPDVQVPSPTHKDVLAQRWSCITFPTNTVLASQALMPAISIPAGLTQETNLPVGLELMGLPYREQQLLQLAYAVEQATLARVPPKLS